MIIFFSIVLSSDVAFYSQSIPHRAMLLSTGVWCRPQTYVIIHMVVVHRAKLSPQGYADVHRAMLSSIWWYSQTHVIVHRPMLSSTGVCYCPYCGILRLMLSSTAVSYCPYYGILILMLLSIELKIMILHNTFSRLWRVWGGGRCRLSWREKFVACPALGGGGGGDMVLREASGNNCKY